MLNFNINEKKNRKKNMYKFNNLLKIPVNTIYCGLLVENVKKKKKMKKKIM